MVAKQLTFDKNITDRHHTKHIKNKVQKWKDIFKDVSSIDDLVQAGIDVLGKDKKNFSKISITAIRLLMKEKADDIGQDKFAYLDVDKSFVKQAIKQGKQKDIDIVMEGQWPRQKRTHTSKEEEEEQTEKIQKTAEEEEEEDTVQEETKEQDVSMEGVEEASIVAQPPTEQDDTEQDADETQPTTEETTDVEEPQPAIEETQPGEEPVQVEEEVEVLPDIKLTHPEDITERNAPLVEDPIQEVSLQDNPTLPSGAIPDGEDQAEQESPIIDPTTIDEKRDPGVMDVQVDEDELPDYEDIISEDEDETPPITSDTLHTQNTHIRIIHEPVDIEIQSMIVNAMVDVTRPYMNSTQEANDFVMDMLQESFQGDTVPEQDVDEQEPVPTTRATPEPAVDAEVTIEQEDVVVEEEEEMKSSSVNEQPPMDMEIEETTEDVQENVNEAPQEEKPAMKIDENVTMKAPSAFQLSIQKKERLKSDNQSRAIMELSQQMTGQKIAPMETDSYEDKKNKERKKKDIIRDYIAKVAVTRIEELKANKEAIVSLIHSGHAKSAWALMASEQTDNPDIQKEIKQEELRLKVVDAINKQMLLRSSDIATEVADFTAKNAARIQQGLDPKNAISKFIYPTFRDPDTFNVVKYRSDADGNVIINRQTGQPIIESISAVDRDDTKKLLEQKQAVDATDVPSPYYPLYGKQARKLFSKNEFNYLGRLFQGPAGKARASIPKPLNIKKDIQTMLTEMSSALEIDAGAVDSKNLVKQWTELQVLKSSFHRYNQFSDYQYIQDKKELQQDGTMVDTDATESAAKLLQSITVQKLLDLLSTQNKQEQEAIRNNGQRIANVDLKDKQQKAELQANEMDIQKRPEDVGAEVPSDQAPEGGMEEETKESEVNLNKWASTQSNYQPPTKTIYRFADDFKAFGGGEDDMNTL